ncbi:prolyl oligopeptidase family serine peptidase [Moraxella osloensis]|nr:prolyl oligopeptidase family serine peptidase [Moraxella osloensis]MBW4015348.1 prolyl oligopeptidase family serine peptidase [Moraxella osloensis]
MHRQADLIHPAFNLTKIFISVCLASTLAACGSDNDSTTTPPAKTGVASLPTGNLIKDPLTTKNLTASALTQLFNTTDPDFSKVAATPKCGVRVEYMQYDTVDVKGNKTDATGAVFIPTGTDASCSGNRPIVLNAHGTATTKAYNFAEVGNANNEAGPAATLLAALFAGQGYVVISPNYAGYDKSSLAYHPYLNAQQQSHEMADALKAGREVVRRTGSATNVADNGKLFITGYSQGGYVAMATTRYLETLKEPVTAALPISGPYAMEAFGDVVFGGKVMLGATFFAPLMARNYQEQYGNIYAKPSDMFAPANADEIPSLLPSTSMTDMQLVLSGKLPASAMFQKAPTGNSTLDALSPSDPAFSFGFDAAQYLIKNDYRLEYLADAQKNVDWAVPYLQGYTNYNPVPATLPEHPLRKALKANDLRGYLPTMPVIMCGGNQDPMVFFDVNSSLMKKLWDTDTNKTSATKLGIIDIDVTNRATRQKPVYQTLGFDTVNNNSIQSQSEKMQAGFASKVQNIAANAAANGGNPSQAVAMQYHGLVTPYCMGVAQTLFSQF